MDESNGVKAVQETSTKVEDVPSSNLKGKGPALDPEVDMDDDDDDEESDAEEELEDEDEEEDDNNEVVRAESTSLPLRSNHKLISSLYSPPSKVRKPTSSQHKMAHDRGVTESY